MKPDRRNKIMEREPKTRVAQKLKQAIDNGQVKLREDDGSGPGWEGVSTKKPYVPTEIEIPPIQYPRPVDPVEKARLEATQKFDEDKRRDILAAAGLTPEDLDEIAHEAQIAEAFGTAQVEPHDFQRISLVHFQLCRHCYAPKSLHPRTTYVKARPLGDHRYFSANAPHFKEGW